jgi:hypothetical protein
MASVVAAERTAFDGTGHEWRLVVAINFDKGISGSDRSARTRDYDRIDVQR